MFRHFLTLAAAHINLVVTYPRSSALPSICGDPSSSLLQQHFLRCIQRRAAALPEQVCIMQSTPALLQLREVGNTLDTQLKTQTGARPIGPLMCFALDAVATQSSEVFLHPLTGLTVNLRSAPLSSFTFLINAFVTILTSRIHAIHLIRS